MNEAGAGGLGREFISKMPVGWNFQTLFFGSAIHRRRDNLAVPVDELRSIGVVEQINDRRKAFPKANDRPGHGAVVSGSADGVLFGDIGQHSPNAQRDVGGFIG
jgi:hypothetical protein